MTSAEALFGMDVGGATSSPSMRVPYGGDGTSIYKPVHPGNSPPPYHPGGGQIPPQTAMHGINMNVVEGGSDHHHHQQQLQQQQTITPVAPMMKKRRGRPRKYDGVGGGTDGTMSLALMTSNTAAIGGSPPPQATTSSGGAGSPGSSFKKARGRPPGSTNKTGNKKQHQNVQPHQLGSSGFGFTPHVIPVKAGEDVSSKIMAFSQNGPRAVCILSANGAISNVTLRQSATSGGTATYEGRFEILSLCGSFLLTEVGGQRSRTGGLSVSLAGPDGRVLGGCVAGLLVAASPIQVIVGSFIPDGRKESKAPNHHTEATQIFSPTSQNPMPMMMQPMLFQGGAGHVAAPLTVGVSEPSQSGSLSDSSGREGGSPPNHSTGGGTASNHHHHHHHNNNNHPQASMGMPWR